MAAPTTLRLTPKGPPSEDDAAVLVQRLVGEGSGLRWSTGRVDVGLLAHLVRDGVPAGRLPVLPLSAGLGELWRHVHAVRPDARVVLGYPVLAPSVLLAPGLL